MNRTRRIASRAANGVIWRRPQTFSVGFAACRTSWPQLVTLHPPSSAGKAVQVSRRLTKRPAACNQYRASEHDRSKIQGGHVLGEQLTIRWLYVSPASDGTVESVKASHPVNTIRLTRARDGRGLRGLGLPVDDACITNDVAHAGGTSLGP